MTSYDALKYISQREHINEETLCSHPLYTPVMLCIEGVAALVRGEGIQKHPKSTSINEREELPQYYTSNLLSPDPYLCYGLILYSAYEPDIMSSMALVHSRIHSVYFKHRNVDFGGLGSKIFVHSLRSLNHHYNAYQIIKVDGE